MPVQSPSRTKRPGATGSQARRRRIIASVLFFLVLQAAAILLVELILFWAGLGEEEIFRIDPVLGTRHMTSKRVTWRSEGFARSYLDADGMREPGLTIAGKPGTYRIALLGDSMVEGLQVPVEKSFGKILERRLNETNTRYYSREGNRRNIEVLNFGTSGYSTVQEYLQLKVQVLKYKPDLVLLLYDSRDMFENWSPVDEVITNVRPYALHLPGAELVVDSYPVRRWLRSPRARLLTASDWLRTNSRIWGLISQAELDWSLHNPCYRMVAGFLTRPKKAFRELGGQLDACRRGIVAWLTAGGPSFRVQFFEDKAVPPATGINPSLAGTTYGEESLKRQFVSVAANRALKENADALEKAQGRSESSGKQNYIDLMVRTEGSLLEEMDKTCRQHKAGFAVAFLPVRAALCPAAGMETSFYDIDYEKEINLVSQVCRSKGIPCFSIEQAAAGLPQRLRRNLYYEMHLTPAGHAFIAGTLRRYVSRLTGFTQDSVPGKASSANQFSLAGRSP